MIIYFLYFKTTINKNLYKGDLLFYGLSMILHKGFQRNTFRFKGVPYKSWSDNQWKVVPEMVGYVLERWSVIVRSPMGPLSFCARGSLKCPIPTEYTYVISVVSSLLQIYGTIHSNAKAVRIKHKFRK